MKAYADTSFLVSLYTPDANSSTAALHMQRSRTTLFVTTFSELELLNAFELRIFRGDLTSLQVQAACAALYEDIEKGVYVLTPLPGGAIDKAKDIARRRTAHLGTRTLDILHVATALVIQVDVLYSFDRQQIKLARAEGLKTPLTPAN